MAPISGLELLQQVRADPALAHLPFIMVSAENRNERVAVARKAGVSGYIVKPFNAATLGDQIASVMGG
jgi:two-component system, chemotaxis family, chemotaxis protein CheY